MDVDRREDPILDRRTDAGRDFDKIAKRVTRTGATVMIVTLKTARLEQRQEAEAVLRVHRPDDDPMPLCAGCAEFACSYTWWPCPQARWAQRVLQEPQDAGAQP